VPLDGDVLQSGVVPLQLLFCTQPVQVFVVTSQCCPPVHGVSSTQVTHWPAVDVQLEPLQLLACVVLHSVAPVVQSVFVRHPRGEPLPCVTHVWVVVLQTWPVLQSFVASHAGQLHCTWTKRDVVPAVPHC
jgi:hypothetical protein